jgi:hypothetical protein
LFVSIWKKVGVISSVPLLSLFSGAVNSGDQVLLSLYFSGGNVVLYAKDWSTGASASQAYSAKSATIFTGSVTSSSNANGFFTGLMTEWYHVDPYYGDVTPVTYSNDTTALSSAWMWMDEYNPSDSSWTGKWSEQTPAPVQYGSNPNGLQKFSSHGATEYSNAYEFITGSLDTSGATFITLVSAGQSTPLSPANGMPVNCTLSGKRVTALAQDGTLTLNADPNTNLTVAGISTGSTSSEKWVLNSAATSIFIPSGTTLTLYYYDVLAQSVNYTIMGGGNPADPTLSYSTAPPAASGQLAPQLNSPSLSQSSPQTIWALRGSNVSVRNPIPASSSERWATQTAEWNIATAYQIPSPITYQHQFLLNIAGTQLNPQWYNNGDTAQVSIPGVFSQSANSRNRIASYAIDGGVLNTVSPTTGTVSVSILMNAPHLLSANSVEQYSLRITGGHAVGLSQASPTGDTFYDSGTTLTVTTDYTWDLANGNQRQNLHVYTLDGNNVDVTRADSGKFTTPTISFSSAHELTFTSVVQYLISFQFKDNKGTEEITPTFFQIETNNSRLISVPQSTVWLDNGTEYKIHSVIWENAEVKPINQTIYTANEPRNEIILARVFDAKLKALDYFGLPIAGAQVTVTLENGTSIQAITGSDGTVNIPMIPLGTFNATITNLGTTTTIVGDASTQAVSTAKVFGSYPTYILIVGLGGIAVLMALILVRRSHRHRKETASFNSGRY